MYAIIKTGGKQYRIKKGDIINVELLKESEQHVEFKEVLFFSDGNHSAMGDPFLNKYLVKGEVLGKVKSPKIIAFKYKRRKNYRRKVGHRQKYSRVKITDIVNS